MSRLPPYHVRRPRLTDRCRDERVVVVEAGAGYGKTVFGAELVDAWCAVGIEVVLLGRDVPGDVLAAHLHAAVRRAGFVEAAAAMASAGEDPQGAVDAVIEALSAEPCAFVIDDAQLADRSGAQLIDYLAGRLAGQQRCVVLSRHLPAGAERLRRAEVLQLSAADLMLTGDELLRLCRDGFGLDAQPEQARAIEEATAGWTAAAVLAASRARRTGEDLATIARAAGGPGHGSGSVAAILDEALVTLPASDHVILAQIARMPMVDRAAVDAAAAAAGFFDRALAAGVPFTVGREGRSELPGPVRDLLIKLAPADGAVLRRAGEEYRRRGELGAALELLVGQGFDADAAALVAEAEPSAVEALDVMELRSVMDRMSDDAVADHPLALLQVARCCSMVSMYLTRDAALERLRRVVGEAADDELRRALEIERAKDDVRESRFAEAEALARDVLARIGPSEDLTRAGGLGALGRAVCWRLDEQGRRTEEALREADEHLAKAADLYHRLGMPAAAATLVPYRAMWIDYARGDPLAALERLDEGLTLAAGRPRTWASLLTYRYEVELELGRFEECEATAAEVLRVADEFDDRHLRSFTTWNQSIVASFLGDAEATVALIRQTEQEASDWFDYCSADFFASCTESLGRVGETAMAFEYLARAFADPQDSEPVLAMAEAVAEARAGDPERAEALLLAAPTHRVDPRENWRIMLFRALAAFRRDDRSAGALAARAFEEASRLGLGHLPLTKERAATEQLLGLAVETGQPAALALETATLPVAVRVLGGFAVTVGGRPVHLSPGNGPQLLKVLSVHGGRLVTDRMIDVLWPDADVDSGRHRLRSLLNRLRSDAGDIVERDGDTLALAAGVTVDLDRFQVEAQRALALGTAEPVLAGALARSAIAMYRGELLPDDPYEDWTERPRERARRLMLQLLDLCADAATQRGDLDELRRIVETTIDLAPYDDERYLRAAAALLAQGRRGAALSVLQRARSALAELGLSPSSHLVSLEAEIVA